MPRLLLLLVIPAFIAAGCARKPASIWSPDRPEVRPAILYLTEGLFDDHPPGTEIEIGTSEDVLALDGDGALLPDGETARLAIPTVTVRILDQNRRLILAAQEGRPAQATPVVVERSPLVPFSYDPRAREVSNVSVAGGFNGWSAGQNPMERGPDGIFRAEVPVPPGTWSYKFVVDGDWIADPANPRIDDSGFGNSLMDVEGEARRTFPLHYMSAHMPGSGPQGAFAAALEDGDRLRANTVTLILNDRMAPEGSYTVDTDAGIVRLDISGTHWKLENFVTLLAESESGAQGEIAVPIIHENAPRSPRDEIIYFPMTDRFFDGDPTNNPPRGLENVAPIVEYKGGDWAGIRRKIEEGYFNELGVTTLWISPPNKNTPKVEQESVEPGRYFTSYHGYWPISSTETNPPFGTMDELRGLVKAAHRNEIAVLLDLVANHVHEDHPIMEEFPDLATPLVLPNGENNIRKFDEHPFTTWFDTFLPSIDYANNPQAIDIMTANAVWWLKETGADGFRHDAVKHIPKDFWITLTSRLNQEIVRGKGRGIYQVGETIAGHGTVMEFVGNGMMDGQFDFPTYFTIQNVLGRGRGSMEDLADTIHQAQRHYPPTAIMSPLVGNHDTARFMAYADGDLPDGVNEVEVAWTNPPEVDHPESYDKLRMAFSFLLSLPGAPMIYYGDEIGMTGAQDPDNRRFMKWDNWNNQENRTFRTVSRLAHVRHDSPALRRGTTQVLHADNERLLIARISPEETVIALANRKPMERTATVQLPSHWGTPTALIPLVTEEARATLNQDTLRIEGGPYSFGYWRVVW